MRELLVVIDYQNDFVTGALGNPAAAALEPALPRGWPRSWKGAAACCLPGIPTARIT